jgi:hypothetical protein
MIILICLKLFALKQTRGWLKLWVSVYVYPFLRLSDEIIMRHALALVWCPTSRKQEAFFMYASDGYATGSACVRCGCLHQCCCARRVVRSVGAIGETTRRFFWRAARAGQLNECGRIDCRPSRKGLPPSQEPNQLTASKAVQPTVNIGQITQAALGNRPEISNWFDRHVKTKEVGSWKVHWLTKIASEFLAVDCNWPSDLRNALKYFGLAFRWPNTLIALNS